MNGKKLTIGLFGFGVVGEGIYKVLLQTPTLNASIKKVCIKDPYKIRNAPAALFTEDGNEILFDPEIDVVVELINDSEQAYQIVTTAMRNKKSVVSANKKMIAEHFSELIGLQRKYEVSFLYEGAVCASIPVIRNLEEYYDNDMLKGLCGIVNGSTNYILTKILEEKVEYSKALLQAQHLGFAEADPSLDVEGKDAVNKLSILLAHGFGVIASPEDILHKGITEISEADAAFASQKNFQVKLTAQAVKLGNNRIGAFVLPQFVKADNHLSQVKNEYNGVVIETVFSEKQFLYGKGAGRFPTASAVLSDISALRYGYKYEYRRLQNHQPPVLTDDLYLRIYVSFDSWKEVSTEDFEYLEELNCREGKQYLVGVISFHALKTVSWFQKPGVSVVLYPDGVLEDLELRKLKQKSLKLAGVETENRSPEFEFAKKVEVLV